jgi:hypothetical protein
MNGFTSRRLLLVLLSIILAVGLMGAALPDEGGQTFVLTLSGAAERPGPGDPDGTGTAVLTFNRGLGQVCWDLSVSGIALPATGAHIHVGGVDSPGPVVVPLTAPDASGVSSGCRAVDRELVKTIAKNPELYYVNVHSTEYPAGAVRAQLNQ